MPDELAIKLKRLPTIKVEGGKITGGEEAMIATAQCRYEGCLVKAALRSYDLSIVEKTEGRDPEIQAIAMEHHKMRFCVDHTAYLRKFASRSR